MSSFHVIAEMKRQTHNLKAFKIFSEQELMGDRNIISSVDNSFNRHLIQFGGSPLFLKVRLSYTIFDPVDLLATEIDNYKHQENNFAVQFFMNYVLRMLKWRL